ncbi:MAG: L-threonylcarbamoyladenylate synthase [Treponema sp.]|jgi:tRNA threonylcarbamoyl adenosine modification protein (Sua5/YciO/YrdC/YwlC family)|nr:L-threonylcarbamoyladenylate synthase [Treponema sp.]
MVHAYIVPENIDNRIIKQGINILSGGGLVAFPTDTSWAISCSFKSPAGIKKLRHISGERDERHFTLLCNSISQVSELCPINNSEYRFLKKMVPGPYLFLLKTFNGAEKILGLRRPIVGVRIPNHPVPICLIETLKEPLYSITAKRSMLVHNKKEISDPLGIIEEDLFEDGWELEAIPGLDMLMDPSKTQERLFSTILDCTGEEIILLRQGAGSYGSV